MCSKVSTHTLAYSPAIRHSLPRSDGTLGSGLVTAIQFRLTLRNAASQTLWAVHSSDTRPIPYHVPSGSPSLSAAVEDAFISLL